MIDGDTLKIEGQRIRLFGIDAPEAAQQCYRRGACTIKGNRSRRGEWIYHLPGMTDYEGTRPEELFCSEAEAQAAGYRRSRAQ